ncbi:unnamed protein product, partial [Meganyctiphanes norvegica]
ADFRRADMQLPGCGVAARGGAVAIMFQLMLIITSIIGDCVSSHDGSAPVDYSGWSVVRTSIPISDKDATNDILSAIENNNKLRLMHTFVQDNALMIDVMKNTRNSLLDTIGPLVGRSDVEGVLLEEQLIEDLGNLTAPYARSTEGRLGWDKYYRASSIQQFSEELASNNDNIELLRIGTTRGGRTIQALVIADNAKREVNWYNSRHRPSSKPIIMLEFGLHAREWISPAVGTYIANELSKMGSSFLQHATWILIPLANPDGYEYSHTNDRMWRKNRRPNTKNYKCPGVDLNRNFDIKWATTGSSSNPCSEVYHGTSPMSEPESIAIKKLITRFSNIQVYMSIHSYSQVVLYPFAYTEDPAPTERELRNFAMAFTSNIKEKGEKLSMVQQAGYGYQSGGGSDDYAYKQGIPYAYTLELPDKGNYGFLMPESEIFSTCREIWAGFKCQLGELVPEAKGICS